MAASAVTSWSISRPHRVNAAFKIEIKPAQFFLGNNIVVHEAQVGAP